MREGPSISFLRIKQPLIVSAWLLTGPVAPGERSPDWSTFAGGICDPMGNKLQQPAPGSMEWESGSVSEELQPMGRTQGGAVHAGLLPVGSTPHRRG